MKTLNHNSQGFTLVEMTVSLGLFTIIMFIATSSFLAIVNSDRKSRSVRIAADNLNVALEDMSRRIKTGTNYYCGAGGDALNAVQDCIAGGVNTLFFNDQSNLRVKYTLDGATHAIMRSVGSEPMIRVTSPEVNVSDLRFLVSGSALTPNTVQPIVVIGISGTLGAGAASTTFKIQTTVTQRVYDN
ncbi:MAG: type II secretion system GspH family protein [Candidatus Pacebacteria bacterium]|jgi:prepilin-type N-terminal cleavage/methylation domain-containing protein|nr:type II secretion system GspH family protein [Candidatus Paceibacterota bacterium]